MEKSERIHRVGSITTGLTLIVMGVCFILHLFLGLISYEMIFRFWPVIIIGLGIELLVSNVITEKLVYDKAAIFLLIVMVFFSMGMAVADLAMVNINV
ncbi:MULTISPECIES: LiaF transmembrane domain-containing protein [unclassified Butyrivibrio]|uniref:LiaF transmembrane domain-containing protein n=1 Tax=unclassified Butyrivibrio TaxID=2639466 RepID=UPI0003B41999|nr:MULTISPECIES: DUF5668 domain-containing protein [unclassified Butyrivibrio]MDC7293400.1 DUF5668 domain-containing protein [Butyrivibrio sp. DSM 10294]